MDGNGQVVNLGAPSCLTIGMILHETLHALGLTIDFQRVNCMNKLATLKYESTTDRVAN